MDPETSSEDEAQSLSHLEFQSLLTKHAKFKERSFETSRNEHTTIFQSWGEHNGIVLLGDSMIERMQTTGQTPNLRPWPSELLLSDADLTILSQSYEVEIPRLENVFNAGVGGDKFENILYRIQGDPLRQLPGLMDTFANQDIKLWLIHAGTNNLHPKRGLSEAGIRMLRILLQAVLRISTPEINIMLTGLFYRTDIPDRLVDQSNIGIRALVEAMNGNLKHDRIVFIPTPTSLSKDTHLDDHVHLNTEGYRLWIKYLLPMMTEQLRRPAVKSQQSQIE